MNVEEITKHLGGEYTPLSEKSGYLRTPLTIPWSGTIICAFLVRDLPGQLRITDDSAILFDALSHSVRSSPARGRALRAIAEQCGVKLSEEGELYVHCNEDDAPYYVARFLEAADRIAYASMGMRPKASERFEMEVGTVLDRVFENRVRRQVVASGASGHTLRFPFAIAGMATHDTIIQPVSAGPNGQADWGNIYKAAGKLMDAKNNLALQFRRCAVLEAADGEDALAQARAVLAESANVLVFNEERPDEFMAELARAA